MSATSLVAAVGVLDLRPPFTAAQWQELEHQALIYKYLVAGLPVPPDLLVPIRRSLESLSARFFHHSALGYCSYYGKKIDPEPGRCRRTDGKKWRCSKDAYPDSKYCERHMHRGRNRSRKLVESQSSSQSSSSSTTVISSFAGSNGGSGSFQSLPFHSIAPNQESSSSLRNSLLKLQVDPSPYDDSTHSTDKEFRYFQGLKSSEAYEQNFSLDGGSSGSARVANSVDETWRLMPSQNVEHSSSRYGSSLQNETRQLYMSSDYESVSLQQKQHILFRNDIGSLGKEEEDYPHYGMRDFLDEGASTANKGLWYNNNNKSSFSNTRLSISVPETSSDISTRNSSPNDV